MLLRTRFRLIAAAFLLTAASVASAQDVPDDKRPRALTVAEQLAIEEAKNAPPKVTRVVTVSSHLRPVAFRIIRFCVSSSFLFPRCPLAPWTNIRATSRPPSRAIRIHQ